MAGNNGGKRPGAGRKKAPHTIESEEMRKQIIAEVAKRVPELLAAKFDLALGHLVVDEDEDGERTYRKSPDGNAIQYLLNQAIGKPSEQVKLTDPDGKPVLPFQLIIKQIGTADSAD